MNRYFIVNVSDLTNDMLEMSMNSNNPFYLRKSADGTKVIIKCSCSSASVDLFKLGVSAMTADQVRAYVRDTDNGFQADEV